MSESLNHVGPTLGVGPRRCGHVDLRNMETRRVRTMCRLLAFLTSSATMKSMASSSWHFFPSLSEDSEAHSIPPRFPLASRAGEDLQEFPCCCEAWESLRIIVGQRGSSNHATFQDWQLALQGMLQSAGGTTPSCRGENVQSRDWAVNTSGARVHFASHPSPRMCVVWAFSLNITQLGYEAKQTLYSLRSCWCTLALLLADMANELSASPPPK